MKNTHTIINKLAAIQKKIRKLQKTRDNMPIPGESTNSTPAKAKEYQDVVNNLNLTLVNEQYYLRELKRFI